MSFRSLRSNIGCKGLRLQAHPKRQALRTIGNPRCLLPLLQESCPRRGATAGILPVASGHRGSKVCYSSSVQAARLYIHCPLRTIAGRDTSYQPPMVHLPYRSQHIPTRPTVLLRKLSTRLARHRRKCDRCTYLPPERHILRL